MSDPTPWGMFAAVGGIFVLTFVWLVCQVGLAVRASRREGALSRPALVLWIVAVAGMFTGPCVGLFGPATALVAAIRLGGAEGKDRDAYLAVLLSGGLATLMVLVAVVGALLSGAA